MPLPAYFKSAAGIGAIAGTVLLGLTGALAAINPGLMRTADSWKLVKPALKVAKETLRQRKSTSPTTTPRFKATPGPPNTRKVNPGLPAVQGR